jgi:hypothetical protein
VRTPWTGWTTRVSLPHESATLTVLPLAARAALAPRESAGRQPPRGRPRASLGLRLPREGPGRSRAVSREEAPPVADHLFRLLSAISARCPIRGPICPWERRSNRVAVPASGMSPRRGFQRPVSPKACCPVWQVLSSGSGSAQPPMGNRRGVRLREETRRSGSGCAWQVGGDGVACQGRGRRRQSRVQAGAGGAGPGPRGRRGHVLSVVPLLRHPDQPPGRTADPGLRLMPGGLAASPPPRHRERISADGLLTLAR